MEFRIETSTPVMADALRAALESERDAWLATTPQDHAEGSQEKLELENSQSAIDDARVEFSGSKAHNPAPNILSRMVEARAKLIKAQSAKPTANTQGALALIADGIEMACMRAKNCKAEVRVSIVGQFHTKPHPLKGLQGNLHRLAVHVDDASLA